MARPDRRAMTSGRPEPLWPLFGALETLDGIGPKTSDALERAGISRPRDLLMTLPGSGLDRRLRASLADVAPGSTCSVSAIVEAHHAPLTQGRPWRVSMRDARTEFTVVFFRARSDWITKQLPLGARRVISGKVESFDGQLQIAHPDYIMPEDRASDIPDFEPLYPLTAGVTQRTMRKAVASAMLRAPALPEWADPGLLEREGWPSWVDALRQAHNPNGSPDLAPTHPARQRLAYDELLAHQLTLALARATRRKAPGRASVGTLKLRDKVLASLPFRPTGAQIRAVAEIAEDMAQAQRMNRLLQGDVGAGKTLVALMALLIAVEASGQGVMMAPTEILARQHLSGLASLAKAAGVRVEILTGRDKGAGRAAKLAQLAAGEIDILVGTHAVFQKDVVFNDLRLVVIDEQHRFGVAQRMELSAKGVRADVLVMTATPIPRSLALTQYGDMDISILNEKPPGRTPVHTALVSQGRLGEVVDRLRQAINDERQAYWVCPLVEESEVSDMTAAEDRFKHLRAVFGDAVGLLHGQMPFAEKDAAMAKFTSGETRILVATTVIEVGVDVPNASIMVIERAESFGLAQLHQLRGRVGRGAAKSTCLLMFQPPLGDTARRRLEILRETEDGFRISEEDLAIRGAGDAIGTAQSGLPRFRIADLEHQAGLMAIAQSDARALLTHDPALDSPRGRAARMLLWLMEQDQAIRLISVG